MLEQKFPYSDFHLLLDGVALTPSLGLLEEFAIGKVHGLLCNEIFTIPDINMCV
jgi:hypothetical protein